MKIRRLHLFYFVDAILFVVVVAFASIHFYKQRQQLYQFQNLEAFATKEAEQLKAEVGELVVLPDGLPTIATVSDVDLLKDEVFFQKAQNGDKVLLYADAKKAYLYRPTEKKVIDFTVLNILPESSPIPKVAGESTEQFTLTILNGTKTRGLAGKYEQEIASSEARLVIKSTGNTVAKQYTDSVMIDVTKKNPTLAKEIATKLQLKLEEYPPDEATPSSDVVIILGQDQVE